MELDIYLKVTGSLFLAYVVVIAWRLLNWVWIKPKRLEKILRNQGFKGSSYKLLYGDMKELAAAKKLARSKPISLSDDFLPLAAPTVHMAMSKHGDQFLHSYSLFTCMGQRCYLLVWMMFLIKC